MFSIKQYLSPDFPAPTEVSGSLCDKLKPELNFYDLENIVSFCYNFSVVAPSYSG